MIQRVWNFEQEPWSEDHDETTINLRAYFDRMRDGCSEHYVEIEEYRRVIAETIAYRNRVR